MNLEESLNGVVTQRMSGEPVAVRALVCDSRQVEAGDVFVALSGTAADGHDYVDAAIERGARAVVIERADLFEGLSARSDLTTVLVGDTHAALGAMAANLHGRPSEHLKLVGITGTNGKTTTAFIIESVLRAAQLNPGLLGTVEYRIGGERLPATHTTPGAPELQGLLAQMREQNAKSAVLEVSSHALTQSRTAGIEFDVTVFTNLTQDHLDYHADMEDYFAAKRKLFTEQLATQRAKTGAACVINADDPYGARLIDELSGRRRVFSYGMRASARSAAGAERGVDVFPTELSWGSDGLSARVHTPGGELSVMSALMGEHNVYNTLAAVAVGAALELPAEKIAAGIAALEAVPGRMEPVPNKLGIITLVDYAHTPDALRNVLAACRGLTDGQLICVFGCGGDRDRAKRPLMAQAVSELADLAILTSDNPRTEDPQRILADARQGLRGKEGTQHLVEVDRRAAISLAIDRALPGDLVMIAGKGHEDYQILGTKKHPFDDRLVAAQALRTREQGEGA